MFPSIYMCETKKFMFFTLCKQLNHMFLRDQGTIWSALKARRTNRESVSNHKLFQFLIAFITLDISPMKVDSVFKLCAEQQWQTLFESLKMTPKTTFVGFLVNAPSVFTFSHRVRRGHQITSLMIRALGGWILILRSHRFSLNRGNSEKLFPRYAHVRNLTPF